jgi:PAS domain S-box-containing protein
MRLPTSWLTKLKQRDTFALRIGVAVAVCMLVTVTVAAAIAYRNTRLTIEEKEAQVMASQLDLFGERVEQSVDSALQLGRDLAADESISSALLDGEGLERFLYPVLRLAKGSLAHQFASSKSGLSDPDVLLLDYSGQELAPWKAAAAVSFAGESWVGAVMQGRAQVKFLGETEQLLVALPVLSPVTGKPEGVLVVRMSIAQVGRTASSDRWRAAVGPPVKIEALGNDSRLRVVMRSLKLASPLHELGWQVALGYPVAMFAREARSILWSSLIAVLVSIPLIIIVALVIGRQLARPLSFLALDAMRISDPNASSSFDTLKNGNGTSEVKALARVLRESRIKLIESISAMRLSQQGLNAAEEGIVISDARVPGAPVVYVNAAFEAISGLRSDELLGKTCPLMTVIPADDPNLAALRHALETGERCDVTLRCIHKNGTEFWNEIRLAPLRDPDGELTHVIALHKDVSDSRQNQERLLELQKMEAIGQLTGGLAHDFNNLMGVVVGNLDLLEETLSADEAVRHQHRAALDAALRASEVARSLLAVARRQPLELVARDVSQLILEMVPLLRTSAGGAVQIEQAFALEPMVARLDAAGLSNVVLNLVINARDAMNKTDREKVLTLRTRAVHFAAGNSHGLAPGPYVAIEVSDNGCGMSIETANRAFEPFFTTKERGKGTGLGLAMVYGFAKQLQGTATINSVLDKGSTVTVYLPRFEGEASGPSDLTNRVVTDASAAFASNGTRNTAVGVQDYNRAQTVNMVSETADIITGPPEALPEKPDDSQPTSTVTAQMTEPKQTSPNSAPDPATQDQPVDLDGRGKVLVVDDEEGLCELACLWIEAMGYEVDGVNSPAEALELLKCKRYEILFSDVVMPGGIDGVQLAREALNIDPGIKILLASGYAKALLEEQNPPGPLLNKPYRKPDLVNAFESLNDVRSTSG